MPHGGGALASGYTAEPIATLEELLAEGFSGWGSPVDIVVRGAGLPDTTRCLWHGFARTLDEREDEIRSWLSIDAADPLPSIAELEKRFDLSSANLPPNIKRNMRGLIHGGVTVDSALTLSCFVDYRIAEYILGDGPDVVTVVQYRVSGAPSYPLYQATQQFHIDKFGADDVKVTSRQEYEASMATVLSEITAETAAVLEGREAVLFLSPIAAQGFNIGLEGWQVVGQWDLQQGSDGTVNAVAFGVPEGDPEHTQTFANLKSRVTTAAASDGKTRIANISGLNKFYRDIGAYGDITPNDGVDNPFTPAKPPPSPTPTVSPSARDGA